jgi:cellulose synthase/poly-beta-1,6-N-acetylglucosamine synthase-like glycosyltransferase
MVALALALLAFCQISLLTYCVSILDLALIPRLRLRHRSSAATVNVAMIVDPYVTVQIPVYNERHVVHRIIDHVTKFDYPRDRMQIQVLDDSTDETTAIVAETTEWYRRQGFNIVQIIRSHRDGYKAGAMRDATPLATGAYIAVFDADFCPAPDFLRQTISHFADSSVAAVQLRWGFLSEDFSVLTRVQAFLLRLHFHVEKPGRLRAGYFSNFNGSGGIWRRMAIEDSGGWRPDTLCEDLDLSYRAQLRGWRIKYIERKSCDTEIPPEINGVRSQQYRWIKGGMENFLLHFRTVLCAPLSAPVKFHALIFLAASGMYLLTLTNLIVSIALVIIHPIMTNPFVPGFIGSISPLILLLFIAASYMAQGPRTAGWRGAAWFATTSCASIAFTLGISANNSIAVLSAVAGKKSEFVRTAKFGHLSATKGWSGKRYSSQRLGGVVLFELAMAVALAYALLVSVARHNYSYFVLHIMALCGFVWIIALTFLHSVMVLRADLARPMSLAEEIDATR